MSTAANHEIRSCRNPRYASNARSFFVPDGKKALGLGVTLWNGYFQYVDRLFSFLAFTSPRRSPSRPSPYRSVRPTAGRMVVNIDVSTGMMYSPGPLIDICLEVLKKPPRAYHTLERLPENDRKILSKYLNRLKIHTTHNPEMNHKPRTLKLVLPTNSVETKFTIEGKTQSVQQYYEATYKKSLNFPKLPCVQVICSASFALSERLTYDVFVATRLSSRPARRFPWRFATSSKGSFARGLNLHQS